MPDDHPGTTREFLTRIGARVRALRTAAGLTVQELADDAGLSRRMVTGIELGQANPSLVTIDKIARALGTDFVGLAREESPDPIGVHLPGQTAGVWASGASRAALLTATHGRPPAELWEWTLQPGDQYHAQPDPTGSEELFYVISGQLTIAVESLEPAVVPAGGAARLASDRQYSYVNAGEVAVHFLRVVRLSASGPARLRTGSGPMTD